jgi:hypothetical protein
MTDKQQLRKGKVTFYHVHRLITSLISVLEVFMYPSASKRAHGTNRIYCLGWPRIRTNFDGSSATVTQSRKNKKPKRAERIKDRNGGNSLDENKPHRLS